MFFLWVWVSLPPSLPPSLSPFLVNMSVACRAVGHSPSISFSVHGMFQCVAENLGVSADMIAQAKSGTGKTCVFAVTALHVVKPSLQQPQALIVGEQQ